MPPSYTEGSRSFHLRLKKWIQKSVITTWKHFLNYSPDFWMSMFTWNESVQVESVLPKSREEPDSLEQLLDKSFSLFARHLPMETSWANAHPESVNERESMSCTNALPYSAPENEWGRLWLMLSAAGVGNELGLSGKIIDFAGPIQVVRYNLEKEHSLFKR